MPQNQWVGLNEAAQSLNARLPRGHGVIDGSQKLLAFDITPNVGRLFRGDRDRILFLRKSVPDTARDEPASLDLVILCDVLHHVALLALTNRSVMAPSPQPTSRIFFASGTMSAGEVRNRPGRQKSFDTPLSDHVHTHRTTGELAALGA